MMQDMSAQLDRRPEATVTLESILQIQVQNQHQDQLVTAALLVITVQVSLAKKSAKKVIIHQVVQKTVLLQMQVNSPLPTKLLLRQLLVLESGP